jgi:hypothetical protein
VYLCVQIRPLASEEGYMAIVEYAGILEPAQQCLNQSGQSQVADQWLIGHVVGVGPYLFEESIKHQSCSKL